MMNSHIAAGWRVDASLRALLKGFGPGGARGRYGVTPGVVAGRA